MNQRGSVETPGQRLEADGEGKRVRTVCRNRLRQKPTPRRPIPSHPILSWTRRRQCGNFKAADFHNCYRKTRGIRTCPPITCPCLNTSSAAVWFGYVSFQSVAWAFVTGCSGQSQPYTLLIQQGSPQSTCGRQLPSPCSPRGGCFRDMSRTLAPPSLPRFPYCDSLAARTKGLLGAVLLQLMLKGCIPLQ